MNVLASLTLAVALLVPTTVTSAHYKRQVTYLAVIEQRGEHTYVVRTSPKFRAICSVVDRHRDTRKAMQPTEFAEAVSATTLPLLLTAVARPESSYVLTAKNPSGATGLFQVMPSVWGSVPADATAQAQQAERVLLYYLKLNKGRLRPALIGYLGGEVEGSRYVDTVLSTFYELRRESRS